MKKNPIPKNCFDWQGPSQVINKWGRIKTLRQIALDGTRVNAESNLGYATQKTNSEKAPR